MAPPPSHIPDYDPRFFRTCTFPVLGRLGYGTRVTINNGLGPDRPEATPMTISMSLWDHAGTNLGSTGELGELSPGQIVKLEIDDILEEHFGGILDRDLLGMLHLVPHALRGVERIDVPSKALMAHMLASDDFVELHQKPKGVITGVAYQTGPVNDPRFGSTRTTVCQAPKVIVSDSVDTLFCLMNLSSDFDYSDTVEMDFWVLRPDGSRVTRSWVEVPPFTYRLVSMTDVLQRAGVLKEFMELGGKGMFLGYSKNGTVVPLSLTRNTESGAIACDHTLPPIFYLTTWGGEARIQANGRLDQEFFAEPRSGLPVGDYSAAVAL